MKHQPGTSLSDPLYIDAVPAGEGLIGMTLFPGRRDPFAVAEWKRDIAIDLAAIRAWGPDLVITLTERREFALLGVPDFEERLRESRLRWEHLPIVDGGTPGRAFEAAWPRVGRDACEILRTGGRVLIHCRAGLGRTGMLAAALLVELGSASQQAIDLVRAARAGAIEVAQEHYVRRLRRG